MDHQPTYIASEQIAVSRLFDAVLDVPCHIDVFEHNMHGAGVALEIWARFHGYEVTKHSHAPANGTPGYMVIACDPGPSRSIRVFK